MALRVGVPAQICGNAAPHLRGNVYVNFRKEEAAEAALEAMAGRFYASRPVPTTHRLWYWDGREGRWDSCSTRG